MPEIIDKRLIHEILLSFSQTNFILCFYSVIYFMIYKYTKQITENKFFSPRKTDKQTRFMIISDVLFHYFYLCRR